LRARRFRCIWPSCPLFTLFFPQDGKTRCTTGSVVSSLYHLKDSENDNRDAGFFVFPDLSVRQEGSYRLKLSLFEVVGCVPTESFVFSLPSPLSPRLSKCAYILVLFHICHNSYIFTPTSAVSCRLRDSYFSVPFYSGFHSFHFVACFESIYRPTYS
jgi:hypothetical protein